MVLYLRLARKSINNLLAGSLGECSFDDIYIMYKRCLKSRCLEMFACDNDDQLFELDRLPSGRYQTLKTRVAIRSSFYRANAIKFMNALQSSFFIRFIFTHFILYHSTFIAAKTPYFSPQRHK